MNEGESNRRLFKKWKVFRELSGFEGCIVLRAPRTPDRDGHPDFLLLQPGREPRMGIVECEAARSGLKTGPAQLKRFVRSFRRASGNGVRLACECIDSAFDNSKKRGRRNINATKGGVGKWLRKAIPPIKGVGDLVELLGRIRERHFIPILVFYTGTRYTLEDRPDVKFSIGGTACVIKTMSDDARWTTPTESRA